VVITYVQLFITSIKASVQSNICYIDKLLIPVNYLYNFVIETYLVELNIFYRYLYAFVSSWLNQWAFYNTCFGTC